MKTVLRNARILTADGFRDDLALVIEAGRITALVSDAAPQLGNAAEQVDLGGGWLLPGFIDAQVNGGGGVLFNNTPDVESLRTLAAAHRRFGTTALLPTLISDDVQVMRTAIDATRQAIADGVPGVIGIHLEGPYINSAKLGAQPPFAKEASLAEVEAYGRQAPMRLITVAPEIHGHLELVRLLADAGIRVQIGHTSGSYEDGVAALEHGAAGFTHLFNAMPGLHHREPGMVGAALAHAQYAEIIPDLLHVHPGAIKVALRSIPHLFCVTDSTAAAGMPDGEYMLGRQVVHKCMGGVRLADGTLAGSTLTMDGALRNLVQIGLSLAEASRRVSTNAADYLGETRRGRLAPGCHADIVVLDRDLHIKAVYIEGEPV